VIKDDQSQVQFKYPDKIYPNKEPISHGALFFFNVCFMTGTLLIELTICVLLADLYAILSAYLAFTFVVSLIVCVLFVLPVLIYKAYNEGVFND